METSETVVGSASSPDELPVAEPCAAQRRAAHEARRRYLTLACCIPVTLVLWASAFSGIKAALREYEPFQLALFRFLVTSVGLVGVAMFARIRIPEGMDLPRIVLGGLLGMTGYHTLLNSGQRVVSAGAASLIINLVPVFTTVLASLFLGERLRRSIVAGLVLSFAGAAVIGLGEGKGFGLNWGALAVLGAAVCQSFFFIVQKPLLAKYTAVEVVCYSVWCGTLGLCLFAPGLGSQIAKASWGNTLCVVYLGLLPGVVAFLAWTKVMSLLPAGKASRILYVSPVLVMLIAWMWHGEVPGLATLGGGVLLIAGVLVANFGSRLKS